VKKSTLTSGQRQNGILQFMTVPIPRHAVNDGPSIVTPGKQVDEVTTKQVMTVPTGQDWIVLNKEEGTIESTLKTTDDGEVSAGVVKISTMPTMALKQKYFDLAENKPLEPCSAGTNQAWDKFAKGGYIITGFLSGGKQCIGERCGKVCGRLFVEKSIGPTVKKNNTEFHPMCKRPAYGCTLCFNGMCFECKNWIEEGASIEY
jgi:hypothetical protein